MPRPVFLQRGGRCGKIKHRRQVVSFVVVVNLHVVMAVFCTIPLKYIVGGVFDKMQFMTVRGSVQNFGVDEMVLAFELLKFQGGRRGGGDEGEHRVFEQHGREEFF